MASQTFDFPAGSLVYEPAFIDISHDEDGDDEAERNTKALAEDSKTLKTPSPKSENPKTMTPDARPPKCFENIFEDATLQDYDKPLQMSARGGPKSICRSTPRKVSYV